MPTIIPSPNMSPGEFMATSPGPIGSNTYWGAQYALVLRRVVLNHAANDPRSLQRHLGPSEVGVECDRQVAAKLAGITATNHVADPWPSIMGKAGHMWMEQAFTADNERNNSARWFAETRVTPHPDHPGTGDLYDTCEHAVVDHKFLGDTTLNNLRNSGPPRRYFVQTLLYGRGWQRMGFPVKRVVLVAWPRTKSTLDPMYVWEKLITPEDEALIDHVLYRELPVRKIFAQGLREGRITMNDVPATPHDEDCYFCPFFRPEVTQGRSPIGCPGHHLIEGRT